MTNTGFERRKRETHKKKIEIILFTKKKKNQNNFVDNCLFNGRDFYVLKNTQKN